MVRTSPLIWICGALLCVSACQEKAKAPETTGEKPAPARGADPAANLPVGGDLMQQLVIEKASRKADAVKAETVIEALNKGGVPVDSVKQFMGRTVLALYCSGGATGHSTSVTVCEYADAEAAKAGLAHSEKQFGTIPLRTLTQNKASVLTLVRATDTPETKAEADKAIEIFTKL